MWKLHNKPDITKYLSILLDKVKERRDNVCCDDVKDYLSNSRLEDLLTAEPDKLYAMKSELEDNLLYETWLTVKTQKPYKKREREYDKYAEKLFDDINYIFDYKSLISDDKEISYAIAELIGVNTCVYCNRQYTFTVIKNADGKNKKKKNIVRPEFDHYIPKGKFPYFALSLYNLIPSCHICNSSCKGSKELPEELNPYLNAKLKEDFVTFSYTLGKNLRPERVVKKELDTRFQGFWDTFEIEEIYSKHAQLEVDELFQFATKYESSLLKTINKMLGSNLSKEDAYKILFGAALDPAKNNDRPFSKLKRDILTELGILPFYL
jgi:hypothetical protein